MLYVGASDGRIYALRASNGRKLFSAHIGDEILASPAVSNGKVYVTTYDDAGKVVAFGL